jgi:hypothetical protein
MNRFKIFIALVLVTQFTACSKKSSVDAICGESGMYSNQTDCQAGNGGAACTMTSTQSSSGSTVCWLRASNQTTTDPTVQPSALCSPAYIETVSGACSSANPVQTITRTCKAGCTCVFGASMTLTQNCSADLYNGTHYSSDCTSGAVEVFNGNKFCSVSGSSCPTGFEIYKSGTVAYTITQKVGGYDKVSCSYTPQVMSYTGEHGNFEAIARETREICSERECGVFTDKCKTKTTLMATVKKVLCY